MVIPSGFSSVFGINTGRNGRPFESLITHLALVTVQLGYRSLVYDTFACPVPRGLSIPGQSR